MLKLLASGILLVLSGMFALGQNTEAGIKPTVISGEAVSVSQTKIVINTPTGQIEALLSDKTEVKRVSPDNPSLNAATQATMADISAGDRIAVTGVISADGKSIPARAVYLMSKSEIAQKRAKESEEWRVRGITGRVISIDQQTGDISVELRTLTGSSTVSVTAKKGAKFLRYAPDSIRFDEAKASSLAEVKTGDMLRALGDRSTDGAEIAAEQIVTGAFQTIAGTVKAIDPIKNEVVITDLNSNKDLTIVISGTSVLKRFPAEVAERMAGAQSNGVRPVSPGRPGPPGDGRPQPGVGRGGRGAGGIDDMIERFPDIGTSDLKVGDMIAISSTKNGGSDRIKVIKLLAGIEPFLRMAQAPSGQRGQSVQGGFTIPGLDGIGFP